MAKRTIKERLIEGLKLLGETEVPSRTRKYVVLSRAAGGHYYVGKAGALRVGETVASSFSAETTRKHLLLKVPS